MKIKENLQLKKDNDDLVRRLQQAEEETKKVLQEKMEVLKLMEVSGGQDTNEPKPEMTPKDTKEDDDKRNKRKEFQDDEDSEDLSVCITFLSFLLSC